MIRRRWILKALRWCGNIHDVVVIVVDGCRIRVKINEENISYWRIDRLNYTKSRFKSNIFLRTKY